MLRGFIDGISWSVPFVFEKVLEFASEILGEKPLEDADESGEKTDSAIGAVPGEGGVVAEAKGNMDGMIKPIAIMRMERENISELDDEDSTIDCSTLETKEHECDGFDDAKCKDAKNEVKMSGKGSKTVSVELSPSQQGETLREIGGVGVKKAIKETIIRTRDNDTTQVKIPQQRKRRWIRYLCIC